HHTWVATPEDPASARFGESIYAFATRELPGAFKRGWRNEAERLTRRGEPVWSVNNEILQGFALTLVVAAGLIALFGWKVAPFIVAHHFL
ncbi:alkane 1-monooxygenase, partial [Escherichia coli]|nr:alkane 1-monooxygenase [Escherichia coli]